ncbi:MAG: carbonic anhydrase [Gemmataceae bacterium]
MFELIYRYDPDRPSTRAAPVDAAEARDQLEEGNRTFARLGTAPHGTHVVEFDLEDIGVTAEGKAPKQQPFAVVLGCADARVPIELIFDRACNELFVVRVAGNILGPRQIGSVEYAVEHLGANLKLLVVLGHSHCGAVTAAVDAFLKPGDYLDLLGSHHIRSIVNDLFPSVRGAAAALTGRWGDDVVKRPGYRAALIEAAVVVNAALVAATLYEEFVRPNHDLRVVFGVFDLATRRVQVPLATKDGHAAGVRLLDAPTDREDFRALALALADGQLVRQLLGV